MPTKSERIAVGKIIGVFGIKGWVKVKSDTEGQITDYSPWYLATPHGLKVFEVSEYTERPQGLIVHFDGVDDRDAALALGKARVEIEKDLLPDLEDDDFYWHQLMGLRVVSHYEGGSFDLGVVERLIETGANDVLVVQGDAQSIDQQERLVPYVPGEFVEKVDLEAKSISVDWDPEF